MRAARADTQSAYHPVLAATHNRRVAKDTRSPHVIAMPVTDNDETQARRAALLARKIAQAEEGRVAMADYDRDNQATLDRTARLRAQRLAQPPEPVEAKKPKAKRISKKHA